MEEREEGEEGLEGDKRGSCQNIGPFASVYHTFLQLAQYKPQL